MNRKFFQAYSATSDGNMSFLYGSQAEVIKNRQAFFDRHHLDFNQAVAMHTQSKSNIKILDSTFAGKGMSELDSAILADALITKDKNLVLFLLTADCLPITIYDPIQQVVALAHLSLANSQLNFVEKVLKTLIKEFKTGPSQLVVSMGPAIKKDSYIYDRLEKSDFWRPFSVQLPNKKIKVDLVACNLFQLLEQGVKRQNIEISSVDTFTDENFFSHRQAALNHKPEGRFATILKLLK